MCITKCFLSLSVFCVSLCSLCVNKCVLWVTKCVLYVNNCVLCAGERTPEASCHEGGRWPHSAETGARELTPWDSAHTSDRLVSVIS